MSSSGCPALSSCNQRPPGISAEALHLGGEDAERYTDLARGGSHRVVAGNKEEPFGALRGILPDKGIPMTLIDAWLEDLRREEEEIAAIVRDRSAAGPSTPLSEVAERLGIDLDEL